MVRIPLEMIFTHLNGFAAQACASVAGYKHQACKKQKGVGLATPF
jgi:hypothetical protein